MKGKLNGSTLNIVTENGPSQPRKNSEEFRR